MTVQTRTAKIKQAKANIKIDSDKAVLSAPRSAKKTKRAVVEVASTIFLPPSKNPNAFP